MDQTNDKLSKDAEATTKDSAASGKVRRHRRDSRLKRILHPTDFTQESHAAFCHALKLAIASRAALDIIHVEAHPDRSDLNRFPSVRDTLINWGAIPEGSSHRDVGKLGITVRKVEVQARDPEKGILQFLSRHNEDLIVLSTHQRHGIERWFHPEIATRVALRSHVATLFIPAESPGFVNAATGQSVLQRVVLPVDNSPSPQTAIDLSAEIVRRISEPDSEPVFSVMHVGPQPMNRVDVRYPQDRGWNWEWLARGDDVVKDIVSVADQKNSQLIAMSTEGHTCWKDILSGSTTENVVQNAPCPVLSVYALEPAKGRSPARQATSAGEAGLAYG